jgi:hypothetical protein
MECLRIGQQISKEQDIAISDSSKLGCRGSVSWAVGLPDCAPWIAPVGDSGSWAVPLAVLALLIPFFFVSVRVDQRVMEHFIPVTTATDVQHNEANEKVLRNAARDANLVSCGFLVAFATVWVFGGVFHR